MSMMRHAESCKGQESEFLTNMPHFTMEEITQVAEATKEQSGSGLWHEARKGRITASR